MATLGQLRATIADDLARSDLGSQIATAISDSIRGYETERLWFNTSPNIEFTTVADRVSYGTLDNVLLPDLIKIDDVKLINGTQQYSLTYYYAKDFDDLTTSGSSGRPTCYTYTPALTGGEMQMRLWPTPSAAYTIRVYATYRLPALTNDDASNGWTVEGEELIRCAAKLRIYLNLTHDTEGAAVMMPVVQALLTNLRIGTSARTGRGIIQPTEF